MPIQTRSFAFEKQIWVKLVSPNAMPCEHIKHSKESSIYEVRLRSAISPCTHSVSHILTWKRSSSKATCKMSPLSIQQLCNLNYVVELKSPFLYYLLKILWNILFLLHCIAEGLTNLASVYFSNVKFWIVINRVFIVFLVQFYSIK